MYRVIEEMRTKDNIYIDRVNRYDRMDGVNGAKARVWFFLYNCTADSNLAYAHAVIMDDNGAVYKTDEYVAGEEEPVEEEPVVEPTEPVEEEPVTEE